MSDGQRVELVRTGYDLFNEGDIDGLLELMTEDIEWPDVIRDVPIYGKADLQRYLTNILAIVHLRMTVGDVIAMGDAVVATTFQQAYDLDDKPLGPARMVAHRFTFRGDKILSMVLTSEDPVPQEVTERLLSR